MRGKYPINWVFDWLGLGSMGEDFELLPSVQPVVQLDGIKWPLSYGIYSSGAINLIAGTVTTVLPLPSNQNESRLWVSLELNRSAAAVGDADYLLRQGWAGLAHTLWQSLLGAIPGASLPIPIIGSIKNYANMPAGSATQLFGRPATLSTQQNPLAVAASAAAAVGTISYFGLYLDCNASAPFPHPITL